MREVLEAIWSFQYSVVPCMVAYLIFDLPILARRLTRRLYAPIYFSFAPFGFADELYAKYFDEDFFGSYEGSISPEKKSKLRVKIVVVSIVSLLVTIFLSPLAAALFCYFFLSTEQVYEFVWTLAIVKALLLSKSLYDLRYTFRVTDKISIYLIGFIYTAYLFLIVYNFWLFEEWVADNYRTEMPFGLLSLAVEFLVEDMLYGVLLVAFLGWLVPWVITSVENDNRG